MALLETQVLKVLFQKNTYKFWDDKDVRKGAQDLDATGQGGTGGCGRHLASHLPNSPHKSSRCQTSLLMLRLSQAGEPRTVQLC